MPEVPKQNESDCRTYQLTQEQLADLRERIREADENPDEGTPWEEVRDAANRRLGL